MVSQNVAEIIKNHVTLEVEGIDRMYLMAMCRGFRQKAVSFTLCINIWASPLPRRR